MKRVFVDANIVIDLLCERYPWFPSVMRIFNMADLGKIDLFCSSLSLGTASYLMENRKMTPQEIFDSINLLCEMCTPTAVDASVAPLSKGGSPESNTAITTARGTYYTWATAVLNTNSISAGSGADHGFSAGSGVFPYGHRNVGSL